MVIHVQDATPNAKALTVDANGYLKVVNSAELPAGTQILGSVKITDGTTIAEVDAIVPGIVTIEAEHHEVHESNMYIVAHRFEDVADDGVVRFRIILAATKRLHCKFELAVGGNSRFDLYQGTTYDADGTELVEYNQDRGAADSASPSTYHTPTVNTLGTKILPGVLPGGVKNFAGGGSARSFTEWILKPSTDYLLVITNVSGGVIDIAVTAEFYEIPIT